jgi:tetrahydromethanopterin S-methyltransferase subunit G
MSSEEWERIWEKLEELERKINNLERQVKRNSDDIEYLYKLFKSHQIS